MVLCGLVSSASSFRLAAQEPLDLFEVQQLFPEITTVGSTQSGTVDDPQCGTLTESILGCERDVYQQLVNKTIPVSSLGVQFGAGSGVMSISTNIGAFGRTQIQWDGEDNNAAIGNVSALPGSLGGISFNLGADWTGKQVISITNLFSDHGYDFQFILFTDRNNWTLINFQANENNTGNPVTSQIGLAAFTNPNFCGLVGPIVTPQGILNHIYCGPDGSIGDFANRNVVNLSNVNAVVLDVDPDGDFEALDLTVEDLTTNEVVYDLGDNPDGSDGTGVGNYRTRFADGGARHVIAGPWMGRCVDTDNGLLHNVDATMDDITRGTPSGTCDGEDDEDAVTLPPSVEQGQSYNVIIDMPANASAEACHVDGWIDFNADGDFDDAGEKIVDQAFANGSGQTAVAFSVPGAAVPGRTYSRFRCSRLGAPSSIGDVDNGEVEDYDLLVTTEEVFFDLGDNPDAGSGTGPGNYRTRFADGGARHQITGPWLGNCVDADDGTLQNTDADADDQTVGSATGTCTGDDDEDGVTLPATVERGQSYSLDIVMPSGASAEACHVDGWIDFNGDGDFEDAGEKVVDQSFANGSGVTAVPFTVPGSATPGRTYARFRCSRAGASSSIEDVDNGEVEDYDLVITTAEVLYDLGDNPDASSGTGPANYRTRQADGGARHLIAGPWLGTCVDADDGTLQNVSADADDGTVGSAVGNCGNNDDEDGVTLPAEVYRDNSYTAAIRMPVNTSQEDCYVDGWIDFNGDGDFDDLGEKIVDQLFARGSGFTSVSFTVPHNAWVGTTYSRFRCSRTGSLSSVGSVDNGEVEDYPITIKTTYIIIPVLGSLGLTLMVVVVSLVAARRLKSRGA